MEEQPGLQLVKTPSEEIDPRWKLAFSALQRGNSRKTSAEFAGVTRKTLYNWMEAHPDFAAMVAQAESQAEAIRIAALESYARGDVIRRTVTTHNPDGSKVVEETRVDWRAAAWWLERRKPNWRNPKPLNLEKLADEQIVRILEQEEEQESEDKGPDPD